MTAILSVEKLVYGGDGLARLPADERGRGKAVFLPFVLAGEQVEAALAEERPGFARARVEKIVSPSARRVEPPCPYFQRCGGCHYQHAAYEHQLEIKAAILKENLRRIAKLELPQELIVHPSPPWNYRNRSRLKIQTQPEFALGYFKFNSHELLPVESCPISSPLINRAIAELWKWGRASPAANWLREVEFFCNAEDSELLVEVYGSEPVEADSATQLAEEIRQALPFAAGVVAFQSDSRPDTVREPQKNAVAGAEALSYEAAGASYRVSAGAFFQVNRHLAGELVQVAAQDLSGDTALDLYAGVGLFSTALARRFAQVIAVEASQTSYADLRHNVPVNVKAVHATTEQYLQKRGKNLTVDLVVVDPPRNGLGETVVSGVLNLAPPRLVYVSCDPATLARDLARLIGAGYRVERAHLVDLFPQTYHLESVFHLVR